MEIFYSYFLRQLSSLNILSSKFISVSLLKLALVICFFGLMGCEPKKPELPKIEMGVSAQVHQRMVITVLSYKLLAGDKDLPILGPPPSGKKYIVMRMLLKNPGLNRGVKDSTLGEVFQSITVSTKETEESSELIKKTIELSIGTASDSLENISPRGSNVAGKKIPAGESISVWIKGEIDAKIAPPYKVTFYTKKGKEASRDVMIELR